MRVPSTASALDRPWNQLPAINHNLQLSQVIPQAEISLKNTMAEQDSNTDPDPNLGQVDAIFREIFECIQEDDQSGEKWKRVDNLLDEMQIVALVEQRLSLRNRNDEVGSNQLEQSSKTTNPEIDDLPDYEEGEIVEGQDAWKESVPEPVTETYWPKLRKILESKFIDRTNLDLQCVICYDTMTTRAEDHVSEEVGRYGPCTHQACVLPCGHMIGLSCMARMKLNNYEEEKASLCPCCRFILHHDECLHHTATIKFAEDKWRGIPQTVPEGGEVQDTCTDCILNMMLTGLAYLAEAAVGDESRPFRPGVRMSSHMGYVDYQMTFMREKLEYKAFAQIDTDNCLSEMFKEALSNFAARCGNAWSPIGTHNLGFKLMFYECISTEAVEDPNDELDIEYAGEDRRLLREDMRG